MGRTSDVNKDDLLYLKLGGPPEITYTMYFRGDAFILDHSPTMDMSVAINRIYNALERLIEEYKI